MRFPRTAAVVCLISATVCQAFGQPDDVRRYQPQADREVSFTIDRHRDPTFPARLRLEGYFDGSATFAISVNHFGELEDYLLLEATHLDFAKAVEKVLPNWDFSVPRLDGEPSSISSTIKVNFERSGAIVYETSGIQLIPFLQQIAEAPVAYRIYGLWELDSLPEPLLVNKPEFHVDLLEDRNLVTAVFQFYIDEQGRVRIPTLREADEKVDERLLLIAQESLREWRFSPPTVRGKPVVTKAAQPFRFKKNAPGLAGE